MKRKIIIVLALGLLVIPKFTHAEGLASKLAGRVLLAVEAHGEAWYVTTDSLLRIYLGRPQDAFNLMRQQGVGISNKNLNKIPIGVIAGSTDSDTDGLPDNLEAALHLDGQKTDTDGDGFSDYLEVKKGFNPTGKGSLPLDLNFTRLQIGKIFLQVEEHGQAWYINPADGLRYFLGRPDDAFAIMRTLGLGIKNGELEQISILMPNYDLSAFTDKIFDLVNDERKKAGLEGLILNNDLSAVAREHSQDLAEENTRLTDLNKACDFPIIHHEGFKFGHYGYDRLHNRGLYYFDKSGENIALMPAAGVKTINYDSRITATVNNCASRQEKVDQDYEKALTNKDNKAKLDMVASEIVKRQKLLVDEPEVSLSEIKWNSLETVATKTVSGWLSSPGHKANIIEADYDATGIGSAYVNGCVITTQIFIRRITCGFKDSACCSREDYYPYCYEPYSCENGKCVPAP